MMCLACINNQSIINGHVCFCEKHNNTDELELFIFHDLQNRYMMVQFLFTSHIVRTRILKNNGRSQEDTLTRYTRRSIQ